eukprot:13703567-Alexandrium_andersonii.AAC.1
MRDVTTSSGSCVAGAAGSQAAASHGVRGAPKGCTPQRARHASQTISGSAVAPHVGSGGGAR